MPLGSADVVNAALELIASQTKITVLNDGSPAAIAATVVYAPTVNLMLREIDPDFARFTKALALAVNPSQVPPWTYEYGYPTDCIRVRQVRPAAGAYSANDPQPVRWNVALDTITAVQTRVILTNQVNALAVYTTNSVSEAQWDSVFADTVIRRLANPLAMALSGRPDTAKELIEQAAAMAQTSSAVDDAMITGP